MVIDDTGSVEGIYAFIYCTKEIWSSVTDALLTDWLTVTNLTTLKDIATQL